MIKRLFIEVSKTNDYNRWQLEAALENCQEMSGIEGGGFFWKIIDNVRFEPNLFDYIKEADEIYMTTSLMPIVPYTDKGSPELWNTMMKAAIDNNLTGKKIFNEQFNKSIHWSHLDKELLDKAFKKNFLYVMSEDVAWEQVDIDKLIREKFKK